MPNPQPNTGFGSDNQNNPMQSLGVATLQQLASVGGTAEGAVGNDSQAIIKALMAKTAQNVLQKKLTESATQLVDNHPDGMNMLAAHVNDPSLVVDPHIDKINALKNLLASDPSSISLSVPGQDNSNATPSSDLTDLQKQAQAIVTPEHRTLLGNILNTIGNVTGINAMNAITEQGAKSMKLGNIADAQKILGQMPLQQLDIDKSALEVKQKINEALTVPPTQAEKLSNAAAYAGYKTTALKDMLDNNNTAMSQQNEIIKNMQGYSSWFNKPLGTMPKEAQSAIKKLQQLQLERIAVSSELNKHQNLLASGGVSTSPFKEGQVYKDGNGNTATFKNGKFQ